MLSVYFMIKIGCCLFLHKSIFSECSYALEVACSSDSNEHLEQRFLWRRKQSYPWIFIKFVPYQLHCCKLNLKYCYHLLIDSHYLLQGDPVTYSMVLDDIGAYYIRVDENSGLLSVRQELTRDNALSYSVSRNYCHTFKRINDI